MKTSILFIKYDSEFKFSRYEIFSGEVLDVIKNIKILLNDIVPEYYSRENLVGEYKREFDNQIIDAIMSDLGKRCDLSRDQIILELFMNLKYFKISYSKNRTDSKTFESDEIISDYNTIINKYLSERLLNVEHNILNGYYIIYFNSSKRTNLFKSSNLYNLSKSELKVFDVISKTTYPVSREDIVSITLLSPRTVSYAVKKLVDIDCIERINGSNIMNSKSNKSNKYVLKKY